MGTPEQEAQFTLSQLPYEDALCLHLYIHEGLSQKDIANYLVENKVIPPPRIDAMKAMGVRSYPRAIREIRAAIKQYKKIAGISFK